MQVTPELVVRMGLAAEVLLQTWTATQVCVPKSENGARTDRAI